MLFPLNGAGMKTNHIHFDCRLNVVRAERARCRHTYIFSKKEQAAL